MGMYCILQKITDLVAYPYYNLGLSPFVKAAPEILYFRGSASKENVTLIPKQTVQRNSNFEMLLFLFRYSWYTTCGGCVFSSDVLANGVKYHRLFLDPATLIRETGTCVCFNEVFLQVWCFVYWNQIPSLIIYDQSYSTPSCYLISYKDSSCKCQYFIDPMPHHMHTVRLCCASFSCVRITNTVL